MKVRRTTGLAGVDFTLKPGDVVDVPDAVGEEWIRIGHAVPAGGQETATKKAPEKAVAKHKK